MEAKSPSSVMTVSDPRAASLLTDPKALEWLKPFIGEALTVGAAARQEGVNPNTMYGWVKRLEAVGLVHVARVEPRKGRAVKRYQAVADTFFVPFAVSPYATPESALAILDKGWEDRLRGHVVRARQQVVKTWGYLIRRHPSGTLMMAAAKDGEEVNFLGDDTPAVLSSWTDMVYLTPEEAKALQRQLHALLGSYEPGPGRRQYALRIGLAPVRQRVDR